MRTADLIGALLTLAFVAGVIMLEVFLAKKESKWPGLVPPLLCLALSLVTVLGFMVVRSDVTAKLEEIPSATAGITTVAETVHEEQATRYSAKEIVPQVAAALLVCNIPTAVLFAVYAACRGGHKKAQALEKMRAQDL